MVDLEALSELRLEMVRSYNSLMLRFEKTHAEIGIRKGSLYWEDSVSRMVVARNSALILGRQIEKIDATRKYWVDLGANVLMAETMMMGR